MFYFCYIYQEWCQVLHIGFRIKVNHPADLRDNFVWWIIWHLSRIPDSDLHCIVPLCYPTTIQSMPFSALLPTIDCSALVWTQPILNQFFGLSPPTTALFELRFMSGMTLQTIKVNGLFQNKNSCIWISHFRTPLEPAQLQWVQKRWI